MSTRLVSSYSPFAFPYTLFVQVHPSLLDYIREGGNSTPALGVEDERDDQAIPRSALAQVRLKTCFIPIETENFTENENQNHADEYARLKHI